MIVHIHMYMYILYNHVCTHPIPAHTLTTIHMYTYMCTTYCTHVISLLRTKGAALGTMVGLLTFGNRKFEDLDPVMRVAIPPLHQATQQLLPLVDRDTEAFGDYMVSCPWWCVCVCVQTCVRVYVHTCMCA